MVVKNTKNSVVDDVIAVTPVFESAPTIVESSQETLRREESRLVKGIFQDMELKGGRLSFPFKKFKGDDIVMYTLIDGNEYELPLSVVRHLNSNCYYIQDAYSKDLVSTDGKPLKNPSPKKTHRFAFKVAEYN